MTTMAILMVLVLATVAMVVLGEKAHLPWPALLTILTGCFVFFPQTPDLRIPPDLILPIFLPPLLWALARRTSWGVIRDQWVTILSLSILLVVATTFAVGAVAHYMLPGLSIAGAVLVGAAIAPPDPVAVDAVAERAGLPRRILATLQTEGLFNDAASIVAFHIAFLVYLRGAEYTPREAVGEFLYSAVIAAVIGFIMAGVVTWLIDRVNDVTARNVLLWVVPFATYILSEEAGASGVIAVVIAAIQMNSQASIEAEDRLASESFWETVEMMFTGVAFGLIGLSVNTGIREIGPDLWYSVIVGVALSVTAFAVRFVWMSLFGMWNVRSGKRAVAPQNFKEVFLMTWSGMRGLVTLALVLSVPSVFVFYHQLVVIALTVLMLTMVIPGLLLPLVMRGIRIGQGVQDHEDAMRDVVAQRAQKAALRALDKHTDELDETSEDALRHWIESRLGAPDNPFAMGPHEKRSEADEVRRTSYIVRREAIEAAQRELLDARKERGMNPQIVDEILAEVDRLAVIASKYAPMR